MAIKTEFSRGLSELFERRTNWLKRAIGEVNPGPVLTFSKKKVMSRINRLCSLAREILSRKRARKALRKLECRRWHPKKGKGFGRDQKQAVFKKWYERQIKQPNCVYIFWSRRKCEYVGRTLKGKGRPQSHFKQYWFGSVTQIDIMIVQQRRLVPMYECLAIDLYKPKRNLQKAARKRFSTKCPVCTVVKEIKDELKSLFKLRK